MKVLKNKNRKKMCLLVKRGSTPEQQIKILNEDLNVYKVVSPNLEGDGKSYISPFAGFEYEMNMLYKQNFSSTELQQKSNFRRPKMGHGFHSFLTEKTAKIFISKKLTLKGFYSKTHDIIKCTIPKETRVIYGRLDWASYKSIISEKIILNEKL